MTEIAAFSERRPCIAGPYRLQWEDVQQARVLLFPEGIVKLNRSAGEILLRCDGKRTTAQIVAELESAFGVAPLGADVRSFLDLATLRRWIEWRTA